MIQKNENECREELIWLSLSNLKFIQNFIGVTRSEKIESFTLINLSFFHFQVFEKL